MGKNFFERTTDLIVTVLTLYYRPPRSCIVLAILFKKGCSPVHLTGDHVLKFENVGLSAL